MDDFDRRILRELETDGRITNASLAQHIGLSPSACLRRVQELEASGLIRGYRAVLDRSRLGAEKHGLYFEVTRKADGFQTDKDSEFMKNSLSLAHKVIPRTVAYGSRTAHRGRQVDARFELNSA